MPYKDPEKQSAAMRRIRKKYSSSEKGLEMARLRKKSIARKRKKTSKDCFDKPREGDLYIKTKQDQSGKCAYCKSTLRKNGGQIDRIMPGEVYSEGNCVLACAECNMHKSNHDVNDFLDDMTAQGLVGKQWTMPGGRYHRLEGGELKPNPLYKGSLSQTLPEKSL